MGEQLAIQVSDETKRLQSPPYETLVMQRDLDVAEYRLKPAPPQEIVAELAACLTLVGAGSMTQDDRTEWIKVAKQTLGDIPASAFIAACRKARRNCKFANELMSVILEEADIQTRRLRATVESLRRRLAHPPVALIEAPPTESPAVTLTELLTMQPSIVKMGRTQGWIEPDILAQYDRIIEQRQRDGA